MKINQWVQEILKDHVKKEQQKGKPNKNKPPHLKKTSESKAKFLSVIKGDGRQEHMEGQCLSYKSHIKYVLQRKTDLRC